MNSLSDTTREPTEDFHGPSISVVPLRRPWIQRRSVVLHMWYSPSTPSRELEKYERILGHSLLFILLLHFSISSICPPSYLHLDIGARALHCCYSLTIEDHSRGQAATSRYNAGIAKTAHLGTPIRSENLHSQLQAISDTERKVDSHIGSAAS